MEIKLITNYNMYKINYKNYIIKIINPLLMINRLDSSIYSEVIVSFDSPGSCNLFYYIRHASRLIDFKLIARGYIAEFLACWTPTHLLILREREDESEE